MRFRSLFILVASLITTVPALGNELPTIYLRVGQRYPLEGLVAENVRITPENLASAQQTSEGTLLIGRQAGNGTLNLEHSGKPLSIRLVVRAEARSTGNTGGTGAWSQAATELKKLPGVQISNLGGRTVIQGEILGRAAYQSVLLKMRNFPANLLVLALPGPGIRASLIEQAQTLLAGRDLKNVRISNAGNRFFLEGTVAQPSDVDIAFETVQSVLPNIENHLAIPLRIDPTISVRVFILELSRHAHEALGLSWPAVVNPVAVLSPQAALFGPTWTASLKHLSNSGQAKVLAEPMLAVKSGSSAELRAGGEIPIRITGLYDNRVTWKNYGLHIKIHIAGVAGRHIRTRLQTESSQLDDATAVDGVPGVKTNSMNTEVDVLEGQPILLTGLFQAGVSKDIEKVPLLGSIPLLGELFKSRRFREHESELLVALLPTFGATGVRTPLESARGLEFDSRWRPLD